MAIKITSQYLNYLAIRMLERFGNNAPTQQQINWMEGIISQAIIKYKISFDQYLTDDEKNLFAAAKAE